MRLWPTITKYAATNPQSYIGPTIRSTPAGWHRPELDRRNQRQGNGQLPNKAGPVRLSYDSECPIGWKNAVGARSLLLETAPGERPFGKPGGQPISGNPGATLTQKVLGVFDSVWTRSQVVFAPLERHHQTKRSICSYDAIKTLKPRPVDYRNSRPGQIFGLSPGEMPGSGSDGPSGRLS